MCIPEGGKKALLSKTAVCFRLLLSFKVLAMILSSIERLHNKHWSKTLALIIFPGLSKQMGPRIHMMSFFLKHYL